MKTRPPSEDYTISVLCVWCMAGHFLQGIVLPSKEGVTTKFCRMGMNRFHGNMQPKRSVTAGKLVDIR